MKTTDGLKANDKTLIQRCITAPVDFVYAPCPRGGTHAKLVRSSISVSQRKRLHELALQGYIAESVTGKADHDGPPETTVRFTATALGRDALNVHAPIKRPVYSVASASDSALLEQASQQD